METRKPFYALVCDPFSFQTRRKKLMPLCVILFVRGRGEKTQFDAFMYYTFCSLTRLLPDAEKKIDAFFVPGHIEKTFAVLVCDHLCSQTREKKNSLMLLCVIIFVPRPEKTLLMLLCVILFVSRRGEKK
jgi:hypothetical protein